MNRSDKVFLIIVVIIFLFSLWGLIFKVHAGEIHDFIKEQEVASQSLGEIH